MTISEEEEILEFLRSEQDAYYKGDFEAFKDHWHHGPVVVRLVTGRFAGTRVHRGWDEILPRFTEGFRQYPQDFNNREIIRNQNVSVQVCGDVAWVCYDQIAENRPEGMHLPGLSHGLKIVQRIDGRWKLVGLVDIAPGTIRDDTPQIELNGEGRVVLINELARERLPSHAGLTLSGDRVRARQRKYSAGLLAAIDQRASDLSTNLPSGYLSGMTSVVPLGDDSDGRPIFCWVSTGQERIVITFDDEVMLGQKIAKSAETFALSSAQRELAQHLAAGHDLASAAAELGVSVNTVRTQLRRMFDKTGAHSQVSLVSLLLSVESPDDRAF